MNIALYVLKSISQAIITPPYIFILLMLAFILYTRNKKIVMMQKMIIGEEFNSSFVLTISQVVIGIFAGTIASVISSYLGVVFVNEATVTLMFTVSIILMIFGNRFICFSYSAGILSLISIAIQLVEWIYNINLVQLDFLKVDVVMIMSLVAILHIIEGILVIIDGDRGAIPVFTNKNNNIIGGFALKRYWMIPVAIMFVINNKNILGANEISVPMSIAHNIVRDAAVGLFSFYGIIGYNAITFTKTKKEKVISSGMSIAIYGVILLIVAQMGRINIASEFLVAVFAPLAHEIMLKFQIYMEAKSSPKYISTEEGLMVLEVAPSSPANEMGIRSGDMVLEVNDRIIINDQDIVEALSSVSTFIWLKIKTGKGEIRKVDYNKMNKSKRLGIVFVPRTIPKNSVVMKYDRSSFKETLEKATKEKEDEHKK